MAVHSRMTSASAAPMAWQRKKMSDQAKFRAALAEVILLWTAIGATTLVFGRVSPAAAWLMAPYWTWVTFATVLNAAFWRLN